MDATLLKTRTTDALRATRIDRYTYPLVLVQTGRGGHDYTALFSNTPRAHELGRTRDWVVLFVHGPGGERRYTVITARLGILRGRRVVRGREAECLEHYPHHGRHRAAA